jgi:MFS family permease
MLVYTSLFYTKHEIGLRFAYWFGFAAIAGAFSGLIAFGVAHVHSSVEQWRLLFIIEGIPTFLLGIIALFFLPNRPESTPFFDEEERKIALRRRNLGTSGDNGNVINKQHVVDAFMDWRVHACSVMFFAAQACLSSLSAFLPSILKTLGFSMSYLHFNRS